MSCFVVRGRGLDSFMALQLRGYMIIYLALLYFFVVIVEFNISSTKTECNYIGSTGFECSDVDVPPSLKRALRSILWPLVFIWWFIMTTVWLINYTVMPFLAACIGIDYKQTKMYKNIYKYTD
jgi:hypothetical protein